MNNVKLVIIGDKGFMAAPLFNTTKGDTAKGNTLKGDTTKGDTTKRDTTKGGTTKRNTTKGDTTMKKLEVDINSVNHTWWIKHVHCTHGEKIR